MLCVSDSTDGLLSYAIYVRSRQKQQQYYTERGKWRISAPREVDYVVKGFAPKEFVTPLYPHFPEGGARLTKEMQSVIEGGVPRSVGGPLLQMVHEFKNDVDDFYRKNASRLDYIHEHVSDDSELLGYTLEELATKALDIHESQLNDVVLFTVHRAVRRNNFLIESDKGSLFPDHYHVQPKRVAEVIDTVRTWVHEHQEYLLRRIANMDTGDFRDTHPLQKFLQKAQRLILQSRKVRSPTTMSSVGPTAYRYQPGQDGEPLVFREVPTEAFTEDDKKIIEFLQLYCIPPRQMTSGSLQSAGSHIMRSTGMYNTLGLTAASMPMFLQELGVISPWENLRLLDQSLALPGHGVTARSDATWNEVVQASEGLVNHGLTDSMQDMRTDWGDLPIYCVDDPNAQEIDDGVSLERIPESDDMFWVRVHVANPSAFIPPEHPVARNAASRYQTFYAPERTYPMLPNQLTREHFGLAPGRPTITFSAKMSIKGEVLDTNITNGIARNVIYTTHGTVRKVFNPDSEYDPLKILSVGGNPSSDDPGGRVLKDQLSRQEQDTFQILRKLVLGFREWRLQNGAIDFPMSNGVMVSVNSGNAPMEPYRMHEVNQGHYVLGDPAIQLQLHEKDPHEVRDLSKENLISLLMNLACWVSGSWCAKRHIPAVYDGTWYHPEYPQLTNENISEYGGDNWLKYAAPKGTSSSEPIFHTPLGLDAYIKSTSPLRRYTDFLAHYQIEAALRYEKEHSRQLDASEAVSSEPEPEPESESDTRPTPSTPNLPFSKETVQTYIDRNRWKKTRLQECDAGSKQFWACVFLFRAFYFAESTLPKRFRCLLHRPYGGTSWAGNDYEGYGGVITSLGVKCHVLLPEDGIKDSRGERAEVDILSVVEGKILAIDMSREVVTLQATRFVKPFERCGEWR